MSFIYFISDAHLGFGTKEEEQIKELRLQQLFDTIYQYGSHLYIVGDLFDFWYEYKTVIPKGHHRILNALDRLRQHGVGIDYLAGNHDFAIGNFFEKDLQIKTWKDEVRVELFNKKFYLSHGDGLAIKDNGYRILKKILRNRFSRWCFRWIHPDLGIRLAHLTSHTSRDYTANKDYGEKDGMRMEATKKIAEGFDYVIMGHQHRPIIEQINDGTYINLGDWMHHFTYATFDGSQMKLISIKNNVEELIGTA